MIDVEKKLSKYVEETTKSKELYNILDTVYEDKYDLGEKEKNGILLAILIKCNTEDKRQKMINILSKWKLSSSDMIKAALQISNGETPEIQKA